MPQTERLPQPVCVSPADRSSARWPNFLTEIGSGAALILGIAFLGSRRRRPQSNRDVLSRAPLRPSLTRPRGARRGASSARCSLPQARRLVRGAR